MPPELQAAAGYGASRVASTTLRRFEGGLVIDLVRDRRRRDHGRRRVLQVMIIMRLALLDAGRAVLDQVKALRGRRVK